MSNPVTDDDMLSIGTALRIVSQNCDMNDVQRRAKWLQDVLHQRGYEIVKRGSDEPKKSPCIGAWHVPLITCAKCGKSLQQCPECRVISGHRTDCSATKAVAVF